MHVSPRRRRLAPTTRETFARVPPRVSIVEMAEPDRAAMALKSGYDGSVQGVDGRRPPRHRGDELTHRRYLRGASEATTRARRLKIVALRVLRGEVELDQGHSQMILELLEIFDGAVLLPPALRVEGLEELGVDPEDLAAKGAVSAQVAIQMAKGALRRAKADFAISVTGIAGPTNEGSSKPVGTVYVGIASRTWANSIRTQIGGTREENKAGFVHFAILTAMNCWDEAFERMQEAQEQERYDTEEARRLEAEKEAERARRDEAAREQAPWQDEAWDGQEEKEEIGHEVEWSDDEE